MIIPVILAGGSGTRLWPLSRAEYPKQFLKLVSDKSLFQETMLRLQGLEDIASPIIVCNERHYFHCMDQLNEIDIIDAKFIIEPAIRNTAPAIASAALYAMDQYDEKNSLLVMPSDHLIKDKEIYMAAVLGAVKELEKKRLITFGIIPDAPSTAYGYIKIDKTKEASSYPVQTFVEKPDLETATTYLESGEYFWNSGIFVFQAETYLNELKTFAPEISKHTKEAYKKALHKEAYVRLDKESFEACPSDSIDYAIFEKTQLASMIPLGSMWSDLGCWTSIADAGNTDGNDNVISGPSLVRKTQNCYINSDGPMVATVGIKDQIIISTKDSVLIANKDNAQDVKELVAALKESDASGITDNHLKVYRPWGYYESISSGPNFQVKRIMVKQGAMLSLQMHYHRTEHWVVVSGLAAVTCNGKVITLSANQSTYIPKESKHRLANIGTEPLHVIEVQSGDYLGEDDIVRFDDIYARPELAEA